MSKVVIIINFDSKYFRFGLILLRSLELHAKNAVKIAYTVNLTANEITTLESISSNLIIRNIKISFLRGNLLRNYMANRKADIFKMGIESFKNASKNFYIMLDADLLLRAPIENLVKKIRKNNVALIYRESAIGFHAKFNASILAVTGDGIHLINEWYKQANERWVIFGTDKKLTWYEILSKKADGCERPLYVRRWRWFWDQISLFEAVRKLNIKFTVLNVNTFINPDFDSSAIIWSAHQSNKDVAYEKFVRELKKS
jgi:hypothetical protein